MVEPLNNSDLPSPKGEVNGYAVHAVAAVMVSRIHLGPRRANWRKAGEDFDRWRFKSSDASVGTIPFGS